jgi:hypothetical protein
MRDAMDRDWTRRTRGRTWGSYRNRVRIEDAVPNAPMKPEVSVMRFTRVLSIVMAGLFLAAVAAADNFEVRSKNPGPGLFVLRASLASLTGSNAMGWAKYEGSKSGTYTFTAQLAIPTIDFKEFGIDPSNGFEDESIEIAIAKKMSLSLTYSHMDASRVIFVGSTSGETKLPADYGDVVEALVNGVYAAGGKF